MDDEAINIKWENTMCKYASQNLAVQQFQISSARVLDHLLSDQSSLPSEFLFPLP